MSEVTQIMTALQQGRRQAAEELLPLVYEELRRLAACYMARERPGLTLQATALVHEAYLRLVGAEEPRWEGRRHFFAAAAEAMRRILIEVARQKNRPKHGGGLERTDLQGLQLADVPPSEELLALDEALKHLAAVDPETAELVKLRFFAGLTEGQAAELLGISRRTAAREWAYARAWLYRELSQEITPQ
jgi:RNA polymerase sigma factor (TIGR02999 family)